MEGFCYQCRTLSEGVDPVTSVCARCKSDNQASYIEALRAENKALKDMLRELEKDVTFSCYPHCPCCGSERIHENGAIVHDPDCRLAALLKEGK